MERLLEISGIFEMKPEEVLSFDEKYVFNNYDGTNYNHNIGPNHFVTFPEEMKQLYEDKIKLQQEVIDMLKEKLKGK
jgi:hypothetical protein